jgi:hypothetical protein
LMDWKLMDDAANIENRNAGNGGDLVKHTVYLAVLRSLLRQDPWSKGAASERVPRWARRVSHA